MSIPLEDGFQDVLGKAARGLKIDSQTLAERAGLSVEEVQQTLDGTQWTESGLTALAQVLDLHAPALIALAQGKYLPERISLPGLDCFNTTWEDMTVNAYLVRDPLSKRAVLFDTGADANLILERIRREGLSVELILLTHTHMDHVIELPKLSAELGYPPTWVGENEPPLPFEKLPETFRTGKTFEVGSLTIETRDTYGHAKGGISYVIHGLEKPLVIVGDALFAGSMGGGAVSFADAIRTNRDNLFTLDDQTVVAPGHGPLTTIGEERVNNPFFAS